MTTISSTSWVVGGQTFVITPTTQIATGIKTGDTSKVVYYVSGADEIATKITLVSAAPTLVSYSGTIQPMLNQGCSCHVIGTQTPRLNNYANVYAARNLLPGMGANYLTAAQEQTLATWISQGALNN